MLSRLHNRMKAQKKSHGFSLVELLIVIVILAILAVAVFAGGSIAIKKAQVSQVTSDLHNFSIALEATLNENPGMATATDATTDTVLDKVNKNLPADYQLSKPTDDSEGNISFARTAGTNKIAVYQSAKTDAWDNNYYVILDVQNRAGGSGFFATVVSAGPDAKAALTTTTGGTPIDSKIGADDIFLLAQYTNGSVSAVTYNMEENPTLVFNAESAPASPAYAHTTPAANCPVIFK